jgi:hypothetical protein
MYRWKAQEEAVPVHEAVPSAAPVRDASAAPVASYSSMTKID